MILEEEMRALVGDHLYVTTDDGSYGFHGLVTAKVEELVEKEGKHYDLCVAIGPMIMMKVCLLTYQEARHSDDCQHEPHHGGRHRYVRSMSIDCR